jgi:hypothetical protein
MTTTIHVGGQDIEIHDRPLHQGVKREKTVIRDWLLSTFPVTEFNPKIPFQEALKEYLTAHPADLFKVQDFYSELEPIRTIIIATGMTYHELEMLKGRLYQDEYELLHTQCTAALGGSATDFLGPSILDTLFKIQIQKEQAELQKMKDAVSKKEEKKAKKAKTVMEPDNTLESTTSFSQDDCSSVTSTVDYTDTQSETIG